MHVSGWHEGLRVIVATKEDEEAPIFQTATERQC
jgi:electron transfer flavoprotein alpha subunit